MNITKMFTGQISRTFDNGKPGTKAVLAITSPLWFTGLLVSGTVEGVIEVAKGGVDAIGNISGSTGDMTFKKIRELEALKASLNQKGGEIDIKFEGGTYKFDKALDLLRNFCESGSSEDFNRLYDVMEQVMKKSTGHN